MDMTIDQQVALDEALVPHASRLMIGKSNFLLRSDLKSKESTLQVVYDVLKITPFYKAFLVTADMNNKKRIVNLKYLREMLQISPRIPNQQFDELPFEEEILAFLSELGHRGEIKMITDGMYHKKNVDFAYLLWEDFVYQIEHKDAKKSNEMYYPWFTKVIVNFFMTKDQSIPRRNKEYYAIASGAEHPMTKASVRKKQSSSDTTVPPLTTKGKRLKTSAMVDKPAKEKQPAKSSIAKGLTVLSEVEQIKLATKKSLTQTHISHASRSGADEGTDDQGDDDDDVEQSKSDNDGDDFVHPNFSTYNEEAKDEESFDH
nr:hypothetical protein [Tanacetum cinerariifolium]